MPPPDNPGGLRQYASAVSRCGCRCTKGARGELPPGLRATDGTRKPVNSRRLDYGAAGVTRSTSRQVSPNRAKCLMDYSAKFQARDSPRSAFLAVSFVIRAHFGNAPFPLLFFFFFFLFFLWNHVLCFIQCLFFCQCPTSFNVVEPGIWF